MDDYSRPFFIGDRMELAYILFFIGGVLTHALYNRLVNLGQTTILMKNTINDCLIVLASTVQTQIEAHELKYVALEIAERSDKYIQFQKQVDKSQLMALQKTLIRNFTASVPRSYNFLIEFKDWDTAMKHINEQFKKGDYRD